MSLSRHNCARFSIPNGVGLVDIMALLDETDTTSDIPVRYRRRTIDTLLGAIEILNRDKQPENAIWIHESNHRAANLIQLILHANQADKLNPKNCARSGSDRAYVDKLATIYGELNRLDPRSAISCEPAIGDMARALLALFGSSTNPVTFSFQVAHLALPACQFRALTLIVSEFTLRALTNCSRRSCDGHLSISIETIQNDIIKTTIQTNISLFEHFVSPGLEVVSALAGILSSELAFREAKGIGTIAEFQFNLLQGRGVGEPIR